MFEIPDATRSLLAQARLHLQNGAEPEAYRLYLSLTRENSCVKEAWYNLGEGLLASGLHMLAASCFQKALRLEADAMTHTRLGECLQLSFNEKMAEFHFRQALEINPALDQASWGLADILLTQNRVEEAFLVNRQVLDRNPTLSNFRWQRAILNLFKGNYIEGFSEFDCRLEWKDNNIPVPSGMPLWAGEPLHGKTLHLFSEQGLGDVIQFTRFIKQIPCKQIYFVLPKELRRLIELSLQDSRITYYNYGANPPPQADYCMALASLPRHFFKGDFFSSPYLEAPKHGPKIKRPNGIRRAVGICWAGNPKHPFDRQRSAPLENFVECLAVPGVELYSLQMGAGTQGVHPSLLGEMGLVQDLSPHICDYADTAHFIQQLDCVVSVDTSITHLCGALGVEGHILISDRGVDWRWQHERSDTPWYPSLTLHRKKTGEDWRAPLKRVADKLLCSRT